ncbi:hypothetical protein SISSUDRAFT_721120 [Sistotremastrum suecicum HHB10207 ss-3]|uniref:Uncharacterized protein n=1 Tax=Sistotremastrum suecicum HHB10207 ss-3 TaxID=1314776 RepID=A0A166DKM1_9AGAM|nr:hypothetical protein SISSUDRAFT_721120 [Sistotremastrum suecicum HHB10207 ss-3]
MALLKVLAFALLSSVVTAALGASFCPNPTVTKTELVKAPSGRHVNFTSVTCGLTAESTELKTGLPVGNFPIIAPAPVIKVRDVLEARSAAECIFSPCACGETCGLTLCEAPPVPISETDCLDLAEDLESLAGTDFILAPFAAEFATLGTCKTSIGNAQPDTSLQACFDDWASLAFQLSEVCPGGVSECVSVVNGAFVQEWIVEVFSSTD